jgi:hypothetical protein
MARLLVAFLVLYTAVKTRQDRVTEIMNKEGYARQDADDMTVSHFELIKKSANRFMTLNSYGGMLSPMDWLSRLRTYSMKIRFNTNADGVNEWVSDTLLYGHIRFTMPGSRPKLDTVVTQKTF